MEDKEIILVDDSEDTLEILELFVEAEYDQDIVKCTSGNEAIKYISENKDKVGIVVSDYNMPEGMGSDLFQFIEQEGLHIPFILLCGESVELMASKPEFSSLKDRNVTNIISKPFKKDDLINAIDENIKNCADFFLQKSTEKKEATPEIEHTRSDYSKMSINKFFKYAPQGVDVFIKLSNKKFVRIIESGDAGCSEVKEIIEKYARKGITYVFLLKNDYKEFMDTISDTLSKALTDTKDENKLVSAQVEAVSTIHDALRELGVSPEVTEMTDKVYKSCTKLLKKSPNISLLLDKLIQNQNYIYELSMINSYLSIATAKETDWASEKTYEKLALASIMLDVSLENEEHAKIMHIKDPKFELLSDKEKEIVAQHPQESVKLLDQVEQFSSDIKNIILEHHELPNGDGFPRKLSATKITPLSAIMIISQYFGNGILIDGKNPKNMQKLKAEIAENFTRANFKRPFEAFVKAFVKN